MTINTADRKDGPYIGNGVTTVFPFNFKVFTSADLYVVLALLSTGGETVLALTTNYTVSLNSDQNASPGGTITTLTTYASTHSVTITSNIPNYQTMDLTNQGGFYPYVITNALDKATIQIQQLAEQAGRALTLPVSSTASNLLPAPSASKALVWNTSATALTNGDLTFTGPTGSTIATFALLANATATLGQVINIAGHTTAGIGGGQFIAKAGSVTNDGGMNINSATAGLYWSRMASDIIPSSWFMGGAAALDDVTPQFIAWISYCANNGKTPYLSSRIHRLTSEIVWPAKMLHMKGSGRGMTYPGDAAHLTIRNSIIYADHTNRNAIKFIHTAEQSTSSSLEGINIIGRDGATGPTCGVAFDCGGTAALFQRDIVFRDCGIYNFTSAFDVYNSGSSTLLQWGVLKFFNNAINRNKHIARTLNSTQINGFVFQHNEAGQNGTASGEGGIDIWAHAVNISDNIMEGQRDPIRLVGAYRGAVVKNNYFEACTGNACVNLSGVLGPIDCGPNVYLATTCAVNTILTNTGYGFVNEPYWWEGTVKMPFPVLGAGSGSERSLPELDTAPGTGYGLYRSDEPTNASFGNMPSFLVAPVNAAITVGARDINPMTSKPMPVEVYTTSGAGSITQAYTIAGASTDYVVMTWIVKQIPDPSGTANPYVSFAVNGTTGNGGRDYSFDQVSNYWRQNEWMIITCAIRLTGVMSSVTLSLFPFGVTPAAGRVARFTRPTVYTTNSVNKIRPFIDSNFFESLTASPATGTWVQGDTIRNRAPAAGQGTFSCTVAGTPGSWVYT